MSKDYIQAVKDVLDFIATQEDLKDVTPGGNIDNIEIIYDERQ